MDIAEFNDLIQNTFAHCFAKTLKNFFLSLLKNLSKSGKK